MKLTRIVVTEEDDRGHIADVLNTLIDEVSFVDSKAETIRGNHYHKYTMEWIFVQKGVVVYWFKKDTETGLARSITLFPNDLLEIPPHEVHALQILVPSQYLTFASKDVTMHKNDYDVVKVNCIIPPELVTNYVR